MYVARLRALRPIPDADVKPAPDPKAKPMAKTIKFGTWSSSCALFTHPHSHVNMSLSQARVCNQRQSSENTSVRSGHFVSTHNETNIHPPTTRPRRPRTHEGPCGRHAVDCVCAMSVQHCMRTCRCASDCTFLPPSPSNTSVTPYLPVLPLIIPSFTVSCASAAVAAAPPSPNIPTTLMAGIRRERAARAQITTRIGVVMQWEAVVQAEATGMRTPARTMTALAARTGENAILSSVWGVGLGTSIIYIVIVYLLIDISDPFSVYALAFRLILFSFFPH